MTGINLFRAIIGLSLILITDAIFAEPASDGRSPIAGKILLSVGEVYSQRNDQKIILKRRSMILENDVIHVGKGARAQIRMVDSALISLRENSVLKINQYRFQKNSQGDQGNSAFIELVSGGLRTISGKIGKSNKKAYELKTPLATIGIRGTDYEVKVENGGLYVGVWKGAIDVQSAIADNNIVLGRERQFSFIFLNTKGDFKGLDSAPSVFSNTQSSAAATSSTSSNNNESSSDKDNESSAEDEQNPDQSTNETVNSSSLQEIKLPTPQLVSKQTHKALIINHTRPSGVISASSSSTNGATPKFEMNGTTIKPASATGGFKQSIGGYDISWGEWTKTSLSSNSTQAGSTISNSDNILWTTYDATSADIVAAKTGSISYSNVIDSKTSGTQGRVTNLDVNMDVNFDSGKVSNGVVSANTASDTWVGLFDGKVQKGDLKLDMNEARVISADPAVDISVRDASGSIQGDFTGKKAEAIIGAFEMSEDNTKDHIEGVFIVE